MNNLKILIDMYLLQIKMLIHPWFRETMYKSMINKKIDNEAFLFPFHLFI
jgi:hypothetical protein